jgi:hypothetical protein
MQSGVPGAMLRDFSVRGRPAPSFLFLLGDIVLNFGEAKYYFDQFYSPFRNYAAPILAIPGNHDGIVALGSSTRTLDAFLANFCGEPFHTTPDALELHRTAQIQPGVYFTFDAPFVRIIALYSNVMEDQGHISTERDAIPELNDDQLRFLETVLKRSREQHYSGALVIAVHHDLYRADHPHPVSSPGMLTDIDSVCKETGVWPHLILSGHGHNYERFLRTVGSTNIVYIVDGTGAAHLAPIRGVIPGTVLSAGQEDIIMSQFDDRDPGYLRVTVDRKRLVVEFQTVSNGVQDHFAMDLQTRAIDR